MQNPTETIMIPQDSREVFDKMETTIRDICSEDPRLQFIVPASCAFTNCQKIFAEEFSLKIYHHAHDFVLFSMILQDIYSCVFFIISVFNVCGRSTFRSWFVLANEIYSFYSLFIAHHVKDVDYGVHRVLELIQEVQGMFLHHAHLLHLLTNRVIDIYSGNDQSHYDKRSNSRHFYGRIPAQSPYSLVFTPGSPSVIEPALRHQLFEKFYHDVGERYATPVNIRAANQLADLLQSVDSIQNRSGDLPYDMIEVESGNDFDVSEVSEQAIREAITEHSSRRVKPLLRSTFFDGIVTCHLTKFRGLADPDALFKPGPPPGVTSGNRFLDLMTSICEAYISSLNDNNYPLNSV